MSAENLTTDDIIDVFKHIEDSGKQVGQFCSEHGINPDSMERALACLIESGEGRQLAATKAFLLGLQLGAMRLNPIAWEPNPEPECHCLICVLERIARHGIEDDPDE